MTSPASRSAGRAVLLGYAALLAACARMPQGGAAAAPPRAAEPPPIRAGQAPPPGPYAPGFDALHYQINLALPDTGSFVRGRTSVRVRRAGAAADTLTLDFTGLAVEAVRVNGEDVAWRHELGRLALPLPAAGRVGDTVGIEVLYQGQPDDGLILGRNVHGSRAAFADNWPDRARFWFPAIDHPSDKATVEFAVDAPAGWEVVANGALQPSRSAVERAGAGLTGRRVWRWATTVPIPTYTMVIGAADFAVGRVGEACWDQEDGGNEGGQAVKAISGTGTGRRTRTGTGTGAFGLGQPRPACVEVSYWAFPEDSAHAARVFRRAAQMVEYYSRLVAPFPYEKLAHVQSSTRFGGMENAGAIFYAERPLAQGRDIEGTVAHETAHQWFGDAVTEAAWEHLWLSEGFATYFGALFFQHVEGEARFREIMESNRQAYLRSDVTGQPMVTSPRSGEGGLFELLNANNYQKGAWVLHMLRGLLGDTAFFEGVRRYYRRHLHGTAVTEDLRRALEEASGRELSWFFEDWVYQPGHPQYRASWSRSAGAGEVELVIEQVQPPEWPSFRMPLTVEIVTAQGVERRTVQFEKRRAALRVSLRGEPSAVRLDPGGWVLKEVADGEG